MSRLDRRRLRQSDRSFGDVGGVVRDALEIAGDLERGQDLAEIARHRLAERQQPDDERIDLLLELVDPQIGLDGPGRKRGIAFDDCLDGIGELLLREPAHPGNQVRQVLEFLVVRLDDVL